jgi:hypothetical protein
VTVLERNHHYKVQWKKLHPKAPTVTMDYMAPNVKKLLKILDESEGVKSSTTEFLYVHMIDHTTGTAKEIVTHEASTGLSTVSYSADAVERQAPQQETVLTQINKIIEQTRKQDKGPVTPPKPRVKLKAGTRKFIVGGFFYKAYEATKE